MIYLVGLGPGGVREMSADALGALRRAQRVYLRTGHHPSVASLRVAGIQFETLDALQESMASQRERAQTVAELILEAAQTYAPVAYAVPGHPLFSEESVKLILERAHTHSIPVRLVPSRSFLEPVLEAIGRVLSDSLQLIDAASLPHVQPDFRIPQIYHHLEDHALASQVQRTLLQAYPAETEVILVRAAGVEGETETLSVALGDLLSLTFDPLTSLFVPSLSEVSSEPQSPIERLTHIVAALRGPGGCPWDIEQTHQSIKPHLIEEAYETLDAIDSGDPQKLREELGDVLLQVVMHAQFAREAGQFDLDDIITRLCDKLVYRHPHVFGDTHAKTAEEVLKNWDALKAKERDGSHHSILAGIPRSLPALQRAQTVSKRAARAGFEWDTIEGVLEKLSEEEAELRAAIASQDHARIEAEIGDMLFTLVNVARHARVNSEESLRVMVNRFIARFRHMEENAQRQQRALDSLSADEWETLWQQAKQQLKDYE
ncbi:MAG: nucleoside triphosphate pyrophosphohydrolase [Fimbriimonadia bacterium]|nr:nucleoside triphosphate pyrophosphohydrolase [Fimbriimonadia bacterium]